MGLDTLAAGSAGAADSLVVVVVDDAVEQQCWDGADALAFDEMAAAELPKDSSIGSYADETSQVGVQLLPGKQLERHFRNYRSHAVRAFRSQL